MLLAANVQARDWKGPALPPNAYQIQNSDGFPSLEECQIYVEKEVQSNWSSANTVRITILVPSREYYEKNRKEVRTFINQINMTIVGSRSKLEEIIIETTQDRKIVSKCPNAKLIETYVVSGNTVLRRSWYDCNPRIGSYIDELRTDCTYPYTSVQASERIEVEGYELASTIEAIYYGRLDLLEESHRDNYAPRFAYVHNYFLQALGKSHKHLINDNIITQRYTETRGWWTETDMRIEVPERLNENFKYFYNQFDLRPNTGTGFQALGLTYLGEMNNFVDKHSDRVLTRFLDNLYKFSDPVAIASGKGQNVHSIDTEKLSNFFEVLGKIGDAIGEEYKKGSRSKAKIVYENNDSLFALQYDRTKWVVRDEKYNKRIKRAQIEARYSPLEKQKTWRVKGDTTTTASGLKYLIKKEGFGDIPQKGDAVTVVAKIWTPDGMLIEDRNNRRSTKFEIGKAKS
ncbi:MAG: hypothetical protein IPK53_04060 [bacterium]|nr:hypothetical protein [bacterium]